MAARQDNFRGFWTPEMVVVLKELLPRSSMAECARAMSQQFGLTISKRSVQSAANTHARAIWDANCNMDRAFSAARREHMFLLAREGRPVAVIAERLGVKDNTIYEMIPASERYSGARNIRFRFAMDHEPLHFLCAPLDVPPEPVTDAGRLLLDCERCHCRWQIGVSEYKEARFCAEPTMPKSSYCDEHAKRSRASATPEWIAKGQAGRFVAWRKKQAETEKQEEEFQEAA